MQFMCEKDVQNVQECKINIMKIPFVLLSHSNSTNNNNIYIIYEDENSKIEKNKKKRFLSSLCLLLHKKISNKISKS